MHRFDGWNNAFELLFKNIALGSDFQRLDDVFVVQKGGQKQDAGLGKFL